jgi:large subunit ribosomal protein L28
MPRACDICGRGPTTGYKIARRGLAKRKGGVGIKPTGITKRQFMPNIQRVWALVDGGPKRINACTKCIRDGKVKKPAR